MDADFEQHYQAAERAYGLGDYAEAHALASALWDQLQSASNEHDPGLILGWRAVVSLLLGHIQLHGLQQPEQAAVAYERVLEGDVAKLELVKFDDEEGKIKALQELQEINMEATKLAVDLGKAARDRHDEASHICARPAPTQANGTLPQWPRKHF